MNNSQLSLLKEAIKAAESSLKLAKSLLEQEEGESSPSAGFRDRRPPSRDYQDRRPADRRDNSFPRRPDSRDYKRNDQDRRTFDKKPIDQPQNQTVDKKPVAPSSEIIGTFDGLDMVMNDGKKYKVPENYISKSLIVEGDTLKLEEEEGEQKFKQIRRVKRKRYPGTLTKKDGDIVVVTEGGAFKILKQTLEYFNAKENDRVIVLTSAIKKKPIWAIIEQMAPPEEMMEEMTEEKEAPKAISKAETKEVVAVPENQTTEVVVLENSTPEEEVKNDLVDEEVLQ